MKPVECPYESDVMTAVSTKRWPNRADADLRDHVAGCEICADVVAVTMAFEEELEAAPSAPPLPESGLVWWRAQMRARQEAARLAVRPITVTQAVAFAAAVGVLGALFGASASWFQRGLHWLTGRAGSVVSVQIPWSDYQAWFAMLMTEHSWLVSTAVLAFVLFPVAIYLLVKFSERPA